jgi:hypothetical protein
MESSDSDYGSEDASEDERASEAEAIEDLLGEFDDVDEEAYQARVAQALRRRRPDAGVGR